MGVDVHILIKNDFYDLDNYEKSMQYVKQCIDKVKKALCINEEYDHFELYGYYDEDDKWADIEFYIPLLDVWLKLRKGYWCVWTAYHFCHITNRYNGRLYLADIAFDIARILGQNEAWYCDEFVEDEFEQKSLDTLLTKVHKRYGITEYPYSELMQYEDDAFPDPAQFYHHTFTEISEEFKELCTKCGEYIPTCITRIGNGYVRVAKNGKINLLDNENMVPIFNNDMDDIQRLNARDFICKLDGKIALFSGEAKQLTDFICGIFEVEKMHNTPFDNRDNFFYLNHDVEVKVMATYNDDGSANYGQTS